MNFENKVVVVTGAGNGIGRELTLELLSRGARVAAIDMRAESLEELVDLASVGERLSTHPLDITDRAAVEALPAAVFAIHESVEVLINNAGIIQPFKRLNELSYDDIDHVMNVNFYGTVYMVKTFLPFLLDRPEAYIANVSSMGGFLPVPGQALYGATKAAVKLMTEALYAELLETSVGVSVVMPGSVATDIVDHSEVEFQTDGKSDRKAMPPKKAARIILDGIEDEHLHILVGTDAQLMSLANRLAPDSSIRMIRRQMKDLLEQN